MAWYGCANPRCPVRHWPYKLCGDVCPGCGFSGYFKGIGVGQLPVPADPEDDVD